MKSNRELLWIVSLLAILFVAFVPAISAQVSERREPSFSPDELWRDLPSPTFFNLEMQHDFVATNVATETAVIQQLAFDRFKNLIAKATAQSEIDVTIPSPAWSGSKYLRFRIHESPLIVSDLARAIRLKTYAGVVTSDPSITTRFTVSETGIRGIVLVGARAYQFAKLEDLLTSEQKQTAAKMLSEGVPDVSASSLYLIFSHTSNVGRGLPPRCYVETSSAKAKKRSSKPAASDVVSTPQLQTFDQSPRKYRLAVAATTEYVAVKDDHDPSNGDRIDDAIRAIVETINMIQAVYLRDLNITFSLIVRRDLISTSAADYTNNNALKLLDQNQARLDKILGSTGYDVGHVFSTAGGGLAGVGVVCMNDQKARGETGLDDPSGKIFAIDYVAHELGHQFGANHTFNGLAGFCTLLTRNPDTAFEPGSGSTIMAYAGNCEKENIQTESDSYFHAISLVEIFTYKSGIDGTCGARSLPSGGAPAIVIDGPLQYTIPRQTRFVLRAHKPSIPASLIWEEFYSGDFALEPAPPDDDSDGRLRPLFRSFEPLDAGFVRYFPRLTTSGSSTFESLPTLDNATQRQLLFRLTARNNAGRSSSADIRVNVVSVADDHTPIGPFAVVEPATLQVWRNGTQQTVRWAVANTDKLPVRCQKIRISSLDPKTLDEVLLKGGLPNIGSATFQVVANPAPVGAIRIVVACEDNIFFGLSPSEVQISD